MNATTNDTQRAVINYNRARAEMEERIGVEPIERLQARRRTLIEERNTLVRQIAPYRARFGPRGTWDVRRKILRHAKMTEIINSLERERAQNAAVAAAVPKVKGAPAAPKVKATISEAEAERLVASDPGYVKMIDSIEGDIAQYEIMEAEIEAKDREIDAVTERINRDQALIRYATHEPR